MACACAAHWPEALLRVADCGLRAVGQLVGPLQGCPHRSLPRAPSSVGCVTITLLQLHISSTRMTTTPITLHGGARRSCQPAAARLLTPSVEQRGVYCHQKKSPSRISPTACLLLRALGAKASPWMSNNIVCIMVGYTLHVYDFCATFCERQASADQLSDATDRGRETVPPVLLY